MITNETPAEQSSERTEAPPIPHDRGGEIYQTMTPRSVGYRESDPTIAAAYLVVASVAVFVGVFIGWLIWGAG